MKFRREGKTLLGIINEECAKGRVSLRELEGGSRRKKVCSVRAIIGKRGLEELGMSLAEIARQVGVSTSGIARAINRLEQEKAARVE